MSVFFILKVFLWDENIGEESSKEWAESEGLLIRIIILNVTLNLIQGLSWLVFYN